MAGFAAIKRLSTEQDSMAFSKKWLQKKLDNPLGWSVVIRLILCAIATLLHGFAIAIQGNGNWIWSGFFIGLILGLAFSALLLFGVPILVRYFWRSFVR
ncbi:MAG: hypothetical protein JWR26_4769 [Pedosphaera sp.]|nr:hypothetical protein [Pedosphaera sp.]